MYERGVTLRAVSVSLTTYRGAELKYGLRLAPDYESSSQARRLSSEGSRKPCVIIYLSAKPEEDWQLQSMVLDSRHGHRESRPDVVACSLYTESSSTPSSPS